MSFKIIIDAFLVLSNSQHQAAVGKSERLRHYWRVRKPAFKNKWCAYWAISVSANCSTWLAPLRVHYLRLLVEWNVVCFRKMGKAQFQDSWLEKTAYNTWLERNPKDVFSAHCRACKRVFDVKTMGESALRSHSIGKKHVANMKRINHATSSGTSISSFFGNTGHRSGMY